MSKKDKGKVVPLKGEVVTDAEILEGKQAENAAIDSAVKVALNESVDRKALLDKALGELFNKHKEKGSLAFEILKAALSQSGSAIQHLNAQELASASYAIADAFKAEMDARWTNDVDHVTSQFYGKTAKSESPEEKTH